MKSQARSAGRWLASAAVTAAIAAAPALAQRPNVVVILADDLGFSDLGCYGGEIETPNLDRLAAGGLRFTSFYDTARCWPTRAALLTGYYAQQVRRDTLPGVGGSIGARPAWARLLPEMLEQAGYRSYHSGKWHVDGTPLGGGFDRSYWLNDYDRMFSPHRHYEDDVALPPVELESGYYTTTAIADHAIRCLADHAVEHADEPFFQLIAFTTPHFPLQAPAKDIARYRNRYDVGWEVVRRQRMAKLKEEGIYSGSVSPVERTLGPPFSFPAALAALGPNEVNLPLEWSSLSASQREFQAAKMAIHAAMVDRIDREVGRVLRQLEEMGALDDTLVLFLSDNGASAEIMVRGDGHDQSAPPGSAASFLCLGPGWSTVSNTPFRKHKTWVHEGGIATPLIAHWPNGIEARGELRDEPGHVVDLVPTILEVAGGARFTTWNGQPVPEPPGISLVPCFAKDHAVRHQYLWWCHLGHRAIRIGPWKLVAAKGDPWELYDLSTDRSESVDLAAQDPVRVRRMEREWTRLANAFGTLGFGSGN